MNSNFNMKWIDPCITQGAACDIRELCQAASANDTDALVRVLKVAIYREHQIRLVDVTMCLMCAMKAYGLEYSAASMIS